MNDDRARDESPLSEKKEILEICTKTGSRSNLERENPAICGETEVML